MTSLSISTVSLAELQYGVNRASDPERAAALRRWIQFEVRPLFGNRVHDVTEAIFLRWIELVQFGRKANKTFAQPDLFLAATALEHNLTLVTRNTRDFADVPGLSLLTPWEPPV